MTTTNPSILVTGATGLVGAATIARLLEQRPEARIHALVRDPAGWSRTAARLRPTACPGRAYCTRPCPKGAHSRVRPVLGDVTRPLLGVSGRDLSALRGTVDVVVHSAANTCFSQTLEDARAVNTAGTANALALAQELGARRFVQVSTAYVAGTMTGVIPEAAHDGGAGWVNAYEQSKHEAEALVRASGLEWVIARPASIVCDDATGAVSQINAVHRALHLLHRGLASMLPGGEDTPVDMVTNDYVARAVAQLALEPDAASGTFHLCAGDGALPLGELFDLSHAAWGASDAWRRRGVVRPALTDLETYRLFESTVLETGDLHLRRITSSLSHFVPQLALPKRFDTSAADALLGFRAQPVRMYWHRLLAQLVRTRWGAATARAA